MFDDLAGEQRSLREKIERFFTRPSNPKTLKLFAWSFIFLGILIASVAVASSPDLQPHARSSPSTVSDPVTPIWYDYGPGVPAGTTHTPPANWACSSLTGFSETQANPNVLTLASSASVNPTSCIDKDPIDLSTSSGRVLEIDQQMLFLNFPFGNQGAEQVGGYFLTTNSTPFSVFPNCNGVAIDCVKGLNYLTIMSVREDGCAISCFETSSFLTFILQPSNDPTIVIGNQDAGCTQGSVMFCISPTVNGDCIAPHTSCGAVINSVTTQLNYTGSSSTQSSSNQTIWVQPGRNIGSQTRVTYPKLDLHQKYYFGIYTNNLNFAGGGFQLSFEMSSNPPTSATSSYTNSMTIGLYAPPLAPCVVNPAICQSEPGGIFGPLLHGLITIFVFVAQNLILGFSYLANILWPLLSGTFRILVQAVQGTLNIVGQFFGLGNVGDLLISFFNGVANFLSNIVTSAFGQILNLVNLLVQLLTWLGSVFGGPVWSGIIGLATLLASGWATIITAYGFLTQLSTNGLLGINYYFLVDWIFGMFMLSTKGMEGFKTWIDLNGLVFSKIAMAMFFFVKESIQALVWIKQMVVNWV